MKQLYLDIVDDEFVVVIPEDTSNDN